MISIVKLSSRNWARSLKQTSPSTFIVGNARSFHHFRPQTFYRQSLRRINKLPFPGARQFSNRRGQNEFAFILLRLAVRGLGQLAGIIWRSGVIQKMSLKNQLIVLGTPIAIGGGIFLWNAERVPYSNRLHYLWLDRDVEMELSAESREQVFQTEKGKFISDKEEIYKITDKIVQDLLQICQEDGILSEAHRECFSLHIIESPIPNAFVLPDGTIFVYTGILPIAETEGGLACILGHEISHALAHHASEKIGILKMLILVYEFIRGFQDNTHHSLSYMFFEFIAITMFQIGLPLAHSRHMESEADRIGLKLAAKAGYNPEEAAAFWERMVAFEHGLKGKGAQQGKGSHAHQEEEEEEVFVEDRLRGALVKATGTAKKSNSGVSSTPLIANTPSTSTPSTATIAPITTTTTASPTTASTTSSTTTATASTTPSSSSSLSATPTSSPSSSFSAADRFAELFSTHPCHGRRIADLRVYAQVVWEDYVRSTDRLLLTNIPVPQSKRYLPYKGIKKNPTDPFEYDYGWDEGNFESALVATHASALMIGQQGQEIHDFLKEIGRLNVPWGSQKQPKKKQQNQSRQ